MTDRFPSCTRCGADAAYCERYDAAYCASCDVWLERSCGNPKGPDCHFDCANRPERPSMTAKETA